MLYDLGNRYRYIPAVIFGFTLLNSISYAAVTQVEGAWIREAPPNATTLAAYMRIHNPSTIDLVITRISSPAFKKIEIHQTTTTNNIVKMRKLEQVGIPAHGELVLAPGQKHLMLFKPNLKLKSGHSVTIKLSFDNGQQQEIHVKVKKSGDMNHQQQDAHTHH